MLRPNPQYLRMWPYIWKYVFADVGKVKLYWSRMGPAPDMTGVHVREENTMWRERHTGRRWLRAGQGQRQSLELCVCTPRTAMDSWEPAEARERQGSVFSSTAAERTLPCPHLDFRLPDPRTQRIIHVVGSHSVSGAAALGNERPKRDDCHPERAGMWRWTGDIPGTFRQRAR